MAVTLIEASKIALGSDETALSGTIMELYARTSDILQVLPFNDISGNAIRFNREKTLPSTEFRKINAGYTEDTGEVDNITDSLAIGGGDIDVDKFLVDTTGSDIQASQEELKIKSLALNITKEYIKGDITSDPYGFDGFQVRCTGDQRVNAGAGAAGDALTLTKLDELIDAVEDPTHLAMNKTMRRRLSAAARSQSVGGYITYTEDSFGRRVTRYNDLPIIVIDKDEANTDIMPFTEAAGTGSAAAGTSIYCGSFMENGTVGIQNGVMDARDLGELEAYPKYRKRIEWYIGLTVMRPRALARLRWITDAAVTA